MPAAGKGRIFFFLHLISSLTILFTAPYNDHPWWATSMSDELRSRDMKLERYSGEKDHRVSNSLYGTAGKLFVTPLPPMRCNNFESASLTPWTRL